MGRAEQGTHTGPVHSHRDVQGDVTHSSKSLRPEARAYGFTLPAGAI